MYVYECIHIKKFKSEILGFGSTEKIVHIYQYMYQKNPKKKPQSLVLSTTINKHKITLSWHLNTCISITFNENSQLFFFSIKITGRFQLFQMISAAINHKYTYSIGKKLYQI